MVVPGVPSHDQWTASWLLYRTCFRCLGPCLSNAAEEGYKHTIDEMVALYPECWSIIVEAEELMRLERMPQKLRQIRSDPVTGHAFKALPMLEAVSELYIDASADQEFWQKHAHDKCLAFRTAPGGPDASVRKRRSGTLKLIPCSVLMVVPHLLMVVVCPGPPPS